MNRLIYVFFIVVAILCLTSYSYSLIKKNEQTALTTWADVETIFHRRADLIPELIEFVNNYAPDESVLLNNVIKARAETVLIQFTSKDLSDPGAMKVFTEVQNNLSLLLSKLRRSVKRYPDLKANQNYIKVMNRIEETEKRMTVSCVQYNKAVETYNQTIRKFPNNVTNKVFFGIKIKQKLILQF